MVGEEQCSSAASASADSSRGRGGGANGVGDRSPPAGDAAFGRSSCSAASDWRFDARSWSSSMAAASRVCASPSAPSGDSAPDDQPAARPPMPPLPPPAGRSGQRKRWLLRRAPRANEEMMMARTSPKLPAATPRSALSMAERAPAALPVRVAVLVAAGRRSCDGRSLDGRGSSIR